MIVNSDEVNSGNLRMGGSLKNVISNKTKAKDEKKKAEDLMKHEEFMAKAKPKPPAPRQTQSPAGPRFRFHGKRLLSRNGGAPFFLGKKVNG